MTSSTNRPFRRSWTSVPTGGHFTGRPQRTKGRDEKPTFWVCEREPYGTGTHIAFTVDDHETVHAFYDAAVVAGGADNGPPGPRQEYTPTYYAAFVHDFDGNNVEAVCHRAE